MEKKIQLEKEKQKLLPNAFEIRKNNGKRKREEIEEDPELITLQALMRKKQPINGNDEVLNGSRKNYTEEEKQIVINLSKKYPKIKLLKNYN